MKNRNRHNQKGYAVAIVLVLIVVGTLIMVMLNRENSFFSKVSGFFNRNQKIQEQAASGVDLARADLMRVAANSRDDIAGTDHFTVLKNGSQADAFNQGLMADYQGILGTRVITPRISRQDGDFTLSVYYFPDNPCVDIPCDDDAAYNEKMPKLMHVISQAKNEKSGEIYTQESRIQLKLVNAAEYSLGILGVLCLDDPPPVPPDTCDKPFPNSNTLDFSPAVYGRSYFNIDPDLLQFVFEGGNEPDDPSQKHIFNEVAEFPLGTKNDSEAPFDRKSSKIKDASGTQIGYRKPIMEFEKGYVEGEPVLPLSTDSNYDPTNDPSTDEFFDEMETQANDSGINLTSGRSCPGGGAPVDICLKFEGTNISEYQCQKYNNDFMGRIDMNVHPGDFTAGTATTLANGNYDRYVGEHAEVYNGTPPPGKTSVGAASGVVYCHFDSCDCNVHVKGIVDGQVTVAATNAVIEGDLVYQDQDDEESDDVLGVIAKKDVIIPAGLPQAATSEPTSESDAQQNIPVTDADPPFSDTTPGGTPTTLAESYLGITNFIPQNGTAYVDRDLGNEEYAEYIAWDTTSTGEYNSPMVLDLDAQIFAGKAVKVDTVFNPEIDSASTASVTESLAFITCENATGPNCAGATEFMYRNPAAPAGESNALFDASGNLVTSTFGVQVQPYFWVDGLTKSNGNVEEADFDNAYDSWEEVARPMNRMINVFGGINSNYYYIYDQKLADNGDAFRMGFRRKLIRSDPRAQFLAPPGYPSTLTIEVYEIYQKSYQGKSDLVP